MVEEFNYYKVNVNYSVGVRFFVGDKDGLLLSPRGQNTVAVSTDKLRDFKLANKSAILEGKIIPVEEPLIEWETSNAISDEEASSLLKNYLKLKATVPSISSTPILYKLLEEAKTRDLSKKTISLIQARIDEVEPDDGARPIFRDDMQGSKDE